LVWLLCDTAMMQALPEASVTALLTVNTVPAALAPAPG
jgi:hypothetical protein